MNTGACRCEGCGGALPSADAVCARCEAELSPPAPAGRYVCPQCQGRFSALAQVLWPPQVAWWRPTTLRLQCPHCSTPLRDRHLSPPVGWRVAAVIVGALASQLFLTGWPRLLLGLALIGVLYAPLARAAWRHRRDGADPHRYIVGSTHFWARGDDALTRAADRLRDPGQR